MAKPELLNTDETAEILGIKPSTLRIWRTQGKGPVHKKIGALVRYDKAVVDVWLAAQDRISTSQRAPQAMSA